MKAFCQGQIARYKVPRYVKFVDSFPMTVTGKIQKFVMRQQSIDELGLDATVEPRDSGIRSRLCENSVEQNRLNRLESIRNRFNRFNRFSDYRFQRSGSSVQ